MAKDLSKTVDAGGFHFEVGDPVAAIGEAGQAVDQVRLAETEAQDPALGTIEAGARDRDALMEAFSKMPKQGGAGAADIRLRQPVVELCLRRKGLQQLLFLTVLFMPVEIQQVVD